MYTIRIYKNVNTHVLSLIRDVEPRNSNYDFNSPNYKTEIRSERIQLRFLLLCIILYCHSLASVTYISDIELWLLIIFSFTMKDIMLLLYIIMRVIDLILYEYMYNNVQIMFDILIL